MNQKKNEKWFLILMALVLFSCAKDNDPGDLATLGEENFVGISMAKKIGSEISFMATENSVANKNTSDVILKKSIESINEVKNEKEKTVFYIINYIDGGYVMLSSDNRMQPIIAFSENNKFVVNENLYSEGLKAWMENAKMQITDIQNSQLKQTEEHKLAWRQVKSTLISSQNLFAKPPPDPCYEHTETEIKGPYLDSTWDQASGFNSLLPYINCSGNNAQVLAGCVPVAMAQVMRYYKYPANYDWLSMAPNYATFATQSFMVDIHNAIRNVYPGQPTYSCGATGVSSGDNMGTVLKNQFHYTSADWSNYNYQVVKDNIEAGKPVILSGSNGTSGHMWVCDGYKSVRYFFNDCTGVGYLYFHMNWGWGGYSNDYFAFDNFNPAGSSYNSNTKMIYNIKP